VGEWYRSFGQLKDADVVRLLGAATRPGEASAMMRPGEAAPGPGEPTSRGVGPAHPAAPL
jgi:hypothetical protein